MVFVEFLEFLCRVAFIAKFNEAPKRISTNESSAGEDFIEYKVAELSDGSVSEDKTQQKRKFSHDSGSSYDADFVPTEDNASALKSFHSFLFQLSTLRKHSGKRYR